MPLRASTVCGAWQAHELPPGGIQTRFFANGSIRGKLAAAFGLLLVLTVGLGVAPLNRLTVVNNAAAALRKNWLPGTRHVDQNAEAVTRYRQLEAADVLARSPADKQQDGQTIARVAADIDATWRAYEASITRLGNGVRETGGALVSLRDSTARVAHQGQPLRQELDMLVHGLRAA